MNHPGRPDASKVNPFDENARRSYIAAFFKAHGRFIPELLEKRYHQAVGVMAKAVNDQGAVEVGHLFFEYMVDATIWRNVFLKAEAIGMAPAWPWPEKKPVARDLSQGISATYREWRVGNGLPVEPAPTDENTQQGTTTTELTQDQASLAAENQVLQIEVSRLAAENKALKVSQVQDRWTIEAMEVKIKELEEKLKTG